MTFSIFSIAIIIIFACSSAISIYRGKERGFYKSLLFLGCSIFSITASIILSPILSALIVSPVFDYILHGIADYNNAVSLYSSLDATAEAVATALLSTLLFVILFFILRGLSYLTCLLIGARAFKNRSDDPGYAHEKSYCGRNSKKLGVLLGLVCAILSTIVLTSPFMGILDIADTAISTAEENLPDTWKTLGLKENEMQRLKVYTKDIPGNIFYHLGGKILFRSTATADFLGKRVFLMDEIDTLSNLINNFSYVLTVLKSPESYHNAYQKYIYGLSENIGDLNICHAILADFISEELALWQEGSSNFITKPAVTNSLEYAFDGVLNACAGSTHENIRENLSCLLRIYAIILDSGILKYDSSDILGIISCINDTGLIDKINAELESNPNLSQLSFASVAISILIKQIDSSVTNKVKRAELMSDLAEAISVVQTRGYGSMDEKVSVLTTYTKDYCTDLGIDLSTEMATYSADVFLDHFASIESEITPEDLENLFNSFRGNEEKE